MDDKKKPLQGYKPADHVTEGCKPCGEPKAELKATVEEADNYDGLFIDYGGGS